MEFKTAKTKIESLSERFYFVLVVCVFLLISNILLIGLTAWSFTHQKTIIVPAVLSKSATVSSYSVDAQYLRQMGLFFAAERLNLTPENVEQSHKILLQYTDPEFYHEFLHILDQEQKTVIDQKLSLVFYPTEVIADPHKLTFYLKGTLNRSVGNLVLKPATKTYLIKFSYHSGSSDAATQAPRKNKELWNRQNIFVALKLGIYELYISKIQPKDSEL